MKLNKTLIGKFVLMASGALVLAMMTGCSSVGEMKGQRTDTSVSLSQNNYQVIKAGAMGDSHGFYLLGILPIVSPSLADAKSDLYKSVGTPLTGKAVALANQTEDRSSLYLILFSIPRVMLTADVIEFTSSMGTSIPISAPVVVPTAVSAVAPPVAPPVTPAK